MSASQNRDKPRIVAGVDGSPSSVDALRWAVRQAELSGGTVDAVIAWQYPMIAGGMGWAPMSGLDDTDYAELATKALSDSVGQVDAAANVPVRQVVRAGNPAQMLLDAASGADLLVVGSRGHGGFADALIGSVSQRCVHHARCPVVVVHTSKHVADPIGD
jgi:nucleotide-binding universal stress UspA family protein